MEDNICTFKAIDVAETGRAIKHHMQRNSVTVKDLSKALMVSPQAVYKWINGEALPTLENMVQISAILGASLDDLVVRTDLYKYEVSEYYVREECLEYGCTQQKMNYRENLGSCNFIFYN